MLVALLSAFVTPAHACGGFVPIDGAKVASDAQQALFELGTDAVSVTYRARYYGDAEDFAWVIAVPGQVQDVVQGDAAWLDEVADASAPVVDVDPAVYEESGCGCGGASKGDAAGGLGEGRNGTPGVIITGTGFAGNLQYTTLAASDADGLVTWLTDHGYDVSLIQSAIEGYVADPLDYEFVAVQVAPDAIPEGEGAILLDPLRIHYGAASDGALHMLFPAKLGVSSTAENVHTEMFVIASGEAAISGWTAPENPDSADGHDYDMIAPDYYDPVGVYEQFLLDLGGDAPVAWEAWSGAFTTDAGERWLTRYDSYVKPSANTVDPVFTDSGEADEVSTIVYLQEESAYEAEHPAAWLLPVGLVGLVGLRRRLGRR